MENGFPPLVYWHSSFQISRSTVDLAYGQLVSEGYLEAKPCQGYFVSHVEELYHIIRENDDMQKKRTERDTEATDRRQFSV